MKHQQNMERETEENSSIRKKYFIKSQIFVMIGYAITQIGSLAAKYLGFSSISYGEIIFITLSTIGFTLLVSAVVQPKKILTHKFLQTVVKIQFAFWLLLYMLWIYFLQEARILGLFFAFMPLIFLATNSNFIQSSIISMAVTIIQLATSYYGIYFAHQSGSFKYVVLYTWFFPSALYIAYVAGLFYDKRREIKQAKRDAELARDALWGEMKLAKKIQTVLLPKDPRITGYDIAAMMKTTDDVGGDYYDVINVKGKDWVVIGDVSGHGVPAGLVMMMVQTSIQTALNQDHNLKPSELLTIINRTIWKNIQRLGEDKFMTITVLACLDNGMFHYSGLHEDIMIYRTATSSVETIKTSGMWLGLLNEIGNQLDDRNLTVGKGDVMILHTDGITEAWQNPTSFGTDRPNRLRFGKDRLAKAFKENCLTKESSQDIISGVLATLGSYEFSDDITLVVLKRL